MTEFFSKSHIKEGNMQLFTSKDAKMQKLYQCLYKIPNQKIKLCTHFWITFTKVGNVLLT